jgi:2-polyprenyl-3-methyl-5-hydroxy-6-metoxy-1,4-benzoquinol methylase
MEEKELLSLIRKKRELSEVTEKVVEEALASYLKKYKISISNLNLADADIIIKAVRANLRKYVGQYQISIPKKEKLLKENNFQALLKTHSSTKERLEIYPQLKEIIAKLNPGSILDLGCGINPLALASQNVTYFASDINESDLNVVEAFFKANKIQGNVFVYDLSKYKNDLPKADLCLLFKVLDQIKKSNSSIIKLIIQTIDCKNILVSFSTKKLSGKTMNNPKRFWFEKIIDSLGYEYDLFKFENELFYLIKK